MSKDLLGEIIRDIESQIDTIDSTPESENIGEVFYLWDGVAKVSGLRNVAYNELVEFQSGGVGIALNLEEHYVWVVILNGFSSIKEGQTAKATGKTLEVPVWDALVWRVVDPLGNPIDGAGKIDTKEYYPIERVATGVMDRKSVHEPMQTWRKTHDTWHKERQNVRLEKLRLLLMRSSTKKVKIWSVCMLLSDKKKERWPES